jgi:hypothetical protein
MLAALASDAEAQGIANSFTELRLLVRPGDKVSVTGPTGEVTGKLAQLSSSALKLNAHGRVLDFHEADVSAIRQRRADSLQNGALIGLCVGSGLVLALIASADDAPLDGWVLMATAAYGGIGAGIGAGVDALIVGRQVIYERAPARGARLRISPVLTARQKGVRASIRF